MILDNIFLQESGLPQSFVIVVIDRPMQARLLFVAPIPPVIGREYGVLGREDEIAIVQEAVMDLAIDLSK